MNVAWGCGKAKLNYDVRTDLVQTGSASFVSTVGPP